MCYDRVEQCDLGGIAKIESQRIIRRIIKDEELHELVLERELDWRDKSRSRNRSVRIADVEPIRRGHKSGYPVLPSVVATRIAGGIAGVELGSVGSRSAGINLFDRGDLRRGQAVGGELFAALDRRRVELAQARIFDQAVNHTVGAVAGGGHGRIEHRDLGGASQLSPVESVSKARSFQLNPAIGSLIAGSP